MKTAIKTIVVLLLIAVVAGIGWMTFGFREWDPEVWKGEFDKIGQSEKSEEQPVVDGDGNELDPDGVNPLPTSMTFSSALNLAGEATSVTVKATIEPSTVQESFKALDWSVAWNNASSDWASGKTVTDYVTVTPTSDGAATATVACKQAFGEQIVLTCSSRFFTEIKATATIDYRAKTQGFKVTYSFSPPSYAEESTQTVSPFNVLIDTSKEAVYIDLPTIYYTLLFPGDVHRDTWGHGWYKASNEDNITQTTGTVGVIDHIDSIDIQVKLDPTFVEILQSKIDDNEVLSGKFVVDSEWFNSTGENEYGIVCAASFFKFYTTSSAQELGFDEYVYPTSSGMTSSEIQNAQTIIVLQAAIGQAIMQYKIDTDSAIIGQVSIAPICVFEDFSRETGTAIQFDLGLIDYADDVDFVNSISLDDSDIVF